LDDFHALLREDVLTPSGSPPVRLLTAFERLFPDQTPQILVQVPDREMWAAALYNGTAFCTAYSADASARTRFNSQSTRRHQTVFRRPLPRWARSIGGVTAMIEVPNMPGIDVVFCGDEPPGPRYDYALSMLFAALWYHVNGQPYNPAGASGDGGARAPRVQRRAVAVPVGRNMS
jgi:hypothetical protein